MPAFCAHDPERYLFERTDSFMPKKGFISNKIKPWIEARKKYHLSHAQVQMARELGLNPKKFGGLANHKQEPWKMPLQMYIEHLYKKRFGEILSGDVKPLEVSDMERRKRKAQKKLKKSRQVA